MEYWNIGIMERKSKDGKMEEWNERAKTEYWNNGILE